MNELMIKEQNQISLNPVIHNIELKEKILTGIQGLDEMLQDGINTRSIVGIVGPAGSGKTIISLQFLYSALCQGYECLYISANHKDNELVSHAKKYGWDLEKFLKNKQVTIECIEPVKMVLRNEGFHLVSNYLDELPTIINESNAKIVIIDSITDFIMLCKNEVESRSRLLNLFQIIKNNCATALITAESDVNSFSTKHGIVEYAVDGLIILRRIQSSRLNEIVHIIQIAKMRWTKHLREIKQYEFTDKGIEVYSKYNVIINEDLHGR